MKTISKVLTAGAVSVLAACSLAVCAGAAQDKLKRVTFDKVFGENSGFMQISDELFFVFKDEGTAACRITSQAAEKWSAGGTLEVEPIELDDDLKGKNLTAYGVEDTISDGDYFRLMSYDDSYNYAYHVVRYDSGENKITCFATSEEEISVTKDGYLMEVLSEEGAATVELKITRLSDNKSKTVKLKRPAEDYIGSLVMFNNDSDNAFFSFFKFDENGNADTDDKGKLYMITKTGKVKTLASRSMIILSTGVGNMVAVDDKDRGYLFSDSGKRYNVTKLLADNGRYASGFYNFNGTRAVVYYRDYDENGDEIQGYRALVDYASKEFILKNYRNIICLNNIIYASEDGENWIVIDENGKKHGKYTSVGYFTDGILPVVKNNKFYLVDSNFNRVSSAMTVDGDGTPMAFSINDNLYAVMTYDKGYFITRSTAK